MNDSEKIEKLKTIIEDKNCNKMLCSNCPIESSCKNIDDVENMVLSAKKLLLKFTMELI